jgi:ABC-type glycerol-3-phosphate transport system substrate-binding protein
MQIRDVSVAGLTRRGALDLAAALGGAVAAACGPLGAPAAQEPQPAPGERVTLEYVGFLTPEQAERVQALFDRFAQQHPNARVEHAPAPGAQTEKRAKMQALVAKEKPDLTTQVASDVIQKYGRATRFRGVARFDEIDQQVVLPALRRVWANEVTAKAALEEVAPQVQQLRDAGR